MSAYFFLHDNTYEKQNKNKGLFGCGGQRVLHKTINNNWTQWLWWPESPAVVTKKCMHILHVLL